ncbi:beta-galactosidase [Paenibacillus qinlingensis]|uniref:Beta-galactosidase n=1 Tax=Paenibacillus qinlingensis TaxID=1837343 RepID=A0ABU1NPF5_9BACL|nr:beta-galactosidase [Paenibacillus qinlingensis]MDR6549298.1 beta-galactosidase [Paenibacillus qinlingensis]
MYFGVCYYPEHWPEERWETDAKMMREAGINIVRIGEFAWSRMERRAGSFDFTWLDRIIGILAGEGIQVILGTPTATPPKWLMDQHPDLYMRDMYGDVRGYGNRRHYCYSNDNYLPYISTIVGKMAERYGNDPRVVAWQIDNEFGCNETTRCYCDNCKTKFQLWLKDKYQEIDHMNACWGTVFWSQIYNEWEEVIVPAYTVFPLHNPGLVLDYRRFASDAVCRFQKFQTDLIRQYAPQATITHNMMGAFNEIDAFDLSEDLDIVSWDNYPNLMFTKEVDPALAAMQHDITRGLKRTNFWVMEHQSGQPGGNIMFPTPKPQELRRWTYQSIAHGADGILYFRWRGCLFGAEQYWHGILAHDGKAGRKYREVQQVGSELTRIWPSLEGSVNQAQVAMIRSYDHEWVFEIQPHIMDYTYMDHFKSYYHYWYDHQIATDILAPQADFSGYRVLVLPHFIMTTDELVAKVYEYVHAGGIIVLDYRAGAKDWHNRMEALTLPGKFSDLLGISVEEYGVLGKEEFRRIRRLGNEEIYHGRTWFDVIELHGAQALATFSEDYFSGCPAVTMNEYGKGKAYYIGTELDAKLRDDIFSAICRDAELAMSGDGIVTDSPRVEIVSRFKGGQAYTFVINHSVEPVHVQIANPKYDLLSEKELHGVTELGGNGVMILCGAESYRSATMEG